MLLVQSMLQARGSNAVLVVLVVIVVLVVTGSSGSSCSSNSFGNSGGSEVIAVHVATSFPGSLWSGGESHQNYKNY